ncbi:uncharacterized protein LOC132309104 [Cornus florida]|uniref:uncharacterized protein LOC132309104 n=1 Tax=Cornus florida TaxID=4283 RepID=UPI00289EC4FA|nr:uncharacterized protein LOC132309104 [Cornus florida]
MYEGQATNKALGFSGVNYDSWKIRMEAFLMSHSYDVWHAVVNGIVVLSPENPFEADKITGANDGKAKHVLYYALKQQEFSRVKNCRSAKEMWDSLQAAHEGSTVIKENKIQLYKVQYEACKMEERETVAEYLFRINDIVNMKSLSEDIKDSDVCKKILRSLTPRFNAKVTILEDQDLSQIKIDDIQASLTAYEIRIGMPTIQRREAALKVKEVTEESEPKSKEDDLEEDEVAYLSKKFKKFRFKKRSQSQNLTCYGCDWDLVSEEDKHEEPKEDECLFLATLETPQKTTEVEKDSEDIDSKIEEILEEYERLAVKFNRQKSQLKALNSELQKSKQLFIKHFKLKLSTLCSISLIFSSLKKSQSNTEWLTKRYKEEPSLILEERSLKMAEIWKQSTKQIGKTGIGYICDTATKVK